MRIKETLQDRAIFFTVFVCIGVISTICVSCSQESSQSSSDASVSDWKHADNKIEALVIIQALVKRGLLYPDTAVEPKDVLEHIFKIENQTYFCNSWLDSRNQLGTLTRSNFTFGAVEMEPHIWCLVNANDLNDGLLIDFTRNRFNSTTPINPSLLIKTPNWKDKAPDSGELDKYIPFLLKSIRDGK